MLGQSEGITTSASVKLTLTQIIENQRATWEKVALWLQFQRIYLWMGTTVSSSGSPSQYDFCHCLHAGVEMREQSDLNTSDSYFQRAVVSS